MIEMITRRKALIFLEGNSADYRKLPVFEEIEHGCEVSHWWDLPLDPHWLYDLVEEYTNAIDRKETDLAAIA